MDPETGGGHARSVASAGHYTIRTPRAGLPAVGGARGTPATNVAGYPFTVSVNRSLVANFALSQTNATKIKCK